MLKTKAPVTWLAVAIVAILAFTACVPPVGSDDPDLETVATPTITPSGGTFSSTQDVTLACATEGATIRYTLDGNDPSTVSTVYTEAFQVSVSSTVKARAFKSGMSESAVSSATITIETPAGQVATPSISPATGTYGSARTVSITCATEGAEIRYTTDGEDPTVTSTLYAAAFEVSATTTVKARAFKSGLDASSIVTSIVTIDYPDVGAVTITLDAATRFDSWDGEWITWFELECPSAGAQIRYTVDGSEPTQESALYDPEANNVVWLSATLKARAFVSGMDPSAIAVEALPDLVESVSGTVTLADMVDSRTLRVVLSDSTDPTSMGLAEYEQDLMSEETVAFELRFFRRAGNAYLHAWCDIDEDYSLTSGDFLGYFGGSGTAAPASPNVSTVAGSTGNDFVTALYGSGTVSGNITIPSGFDLTDHMIGVVVDTDTISENGNAGSAEIPCVAGQFEYTYQVECAAGTYYAYVFVISSVPELTHMGYYGSATADPASAVTFTVSEGSITSEIDIGCVPAAP
ncbi:MAG: chitobiase/beta-hexosaminidase C-terminal domain-containing protein [Spirochaetales bacterium]|nr:chitobiase/beta-hexosaminidase C-terminal domain-containing protein [Spirochaetales bacterium]